MTNAARTPRTLPDPLYPIVRVFHAEVRSAIVLNPHLVRIVFGGEDLTEFEPIGPDQFIYVFVPRPGEIDPRVPHGFSWDEWRERPEPERQVGRYYTVRKWDPEKSEVTMDFVVHGDGPLTTWAMSAKAGDRVALWGPRKGYEPASGVETFVLVGDETGLPAIGAILESLRPGQRARAFVEVPGPAAVQDLTSPAQFEVKWLLRGEAPAGKWDGLAEAVRVAPWPKGQVYAWGGGEFRAMNTLRKFLRDERGLTPADMSVIAYWRHKDHDEDEGTKT